jgi:hypothetical protein
VSAPEFYRGDQKACKNISTRCALRERAGNICRALGRARAARRHAGRVTNERRLALRRVVVEKSRFTATPTPRSARDPDARCTAPAPKRAASRSRVSRRRARRPPRLQAERELRVRLQCRQVVPREPHESERPCPRSRRVATPQPRKAPRHIGRRPQRLLPREDPKVAAFQLDAHTASQESAAASAARRFPRHCADSLRFPCVRLRRRSACAPS